MTTPSSGGLRPLALLVVLGVLTYLSVVALDRTPLTLAVFRGGENAPAYVVRLKLGRAESEVTPAGLTPAQRREAARAILAGDGTALRQLSKLLGASGRFAAAPGEAGEWPWYLGGGFKALGEIARASAWIDDFTPPERVALALLAQAPPAPPWAGALPVPTAPAAGKDSPPKLAGTPLPSAPVTPTTAAVAAPLQVEIRNGCGMTNAADVVARAVQDAGLVVVRVGNAPNFRFRKTVVDSSVGIPVALEDVLTKLGLDDEAVREAPQPVPGVDVVITVGRDYRKIRERLK